MSNEEQCVRFITYILSKTSNELCDYATTITGVSEKDVQDFLKHANLISKDNNSLRQMQSKGGQSTSEAKRTMARINGAKGGRPTKEEQEKYRGIKRYVRKVAGIIQELYCIEHAPPDSTVDASIDEQYKCVVAGCPREATFFIGNAALDARAKLQMQRETLS